MRMGMSMWVEFMPCMVMVVTEGCTVGLTIMASTAMSRGMSPFVFVVHSNALASIILLPCSFINFRNRTEQSLFTSPLLVRFFFLGLTGVQTWCMRLKGPFFVPVFKPLGIPIASICGCIFFSDTFHYGSMMGALIIGMGYYIVMWGQIKEDETTTHKGINVGSSNSSDEKLPLLQDETEAV